MRFAADNRINSRMHTQPGRHWARHWATCERSEHVPADAQCPNCHEVRMDYLVWNDEDEIACTTCGETYTL